MRHEVLLSHHERVRGGTGLLKTAVRLLDQPCQGVVHRGQRSWVNSDTCLQTTRHEVDGYFNLMMGLASGGQQSAETGFDGKAMWLNLDRPRYLIPKRAGASRNSDIRRT